MTLSTVSSTMNVVSIFLREQVREPIVLFWNMAVPGIFYLILTYSGGMSLTPESALAVILAYSCGSIALYSTAVVLIARRESGFIKSFANVPGCYHILVVAQILVAEILGIASMIVVLLIGLTFNMIPDIAFAMKSALIFAGWLAICSFGACGFMGLPLSMRTMNTLANIIMFSLLMVLVFGEMSEGSAAKLIASINPLSIIAWSFDFRAAPDAITISALLLALLCAGCIGLVFPILERRN